MHDRRQLIAEAQKLCREIRLRSDFTAGSVAAAIRASNGKIYTGICLDLACGLGFCAEAAAIADMLKAGESRILQIVAMNADRILAPCGRCREMMLQLNPHNSGAEIILDPTRSVPLKDLLPEHWLGAGE